MRRFNVTGTCVGHEHYMVDISGKLDEIQVLVERRQYFTINRARQYGKTTTLLHLERRLEKNGEYICASISFGDAGFHAFETEELFCRMLMQKIEKALKTSNVPKDYAKKWFNADVKELAMLNGHITNLCEGKKVVLMIDEVDKSTNNRLFLHFLGMLREKFLARTAGNDHTFHTVILAGVTDIKNLKLKMINDGVYSRLKDEGRIVNSPWNIAAKFDVEMSFSPDEISTMLHEYESDFKTGMDISVLSNAVYSHTNGYPFLVSRICLCIDEELDNNWTLEGVNDAVQIILEEPNVLFDDMFKNLENHKNLYDFMYELLILGESKSFNLYDQAVSLANTYGYIKKGAGRKQTVVSNRIFETMIIDYFVARNENSGQAKRVNGTIYQDVVSGDKFDMATCLKKFAVHYRELFTLKEETFFERHGRLLFLTFLKPLLNGQGHYHIESQLTDQRRMDLVVDFEKEQHILELKLWKGDAHREKAYQQLLGYMEKKGANEGYLLTFDFRKERAGEYTAEWVEVDGKRIFEVVV